MQKILDKFTKFQCLLIGTISSICLYFLYIGFDSNVLNNFLKQITLNESLFFVLICSFFLFIYNGIYEHTSNKYPETEVVIKWVTISFFIISVITYLTLRYAKNDYQTLLALLVSSLLLGAGWWVQATISRVQAKTAYTVDILMNQRNSELFFKKNDDASKTFGLKATIGEMIALHHFSPNNEKLQSYTIKDEYVTACNNFKYILNYYEFIASGINRGDFDEDLIYACFSGLLPTLEKRGFYIIKAAREHVDSHCFEELLLLIERWHPTKKSLIKNERNNGTLPELYTVVDFKKPTP